jgi:hypothetical protein
MLLLPIVENGLHWHNIYIKVCKNQSIISKLKTRAHTQIHKQNGVNVSILFSSEKIAIIKNMGIFNISTYW